MKKQLIILSLALAAGAWTAQAQRALPTASQDAFVEVAEATVNGVVSVKSYATPRQAYSNGDGMGFFDDPFFQYFFGQPQRRQQPQKEPEQQQQQLGLGSGVIISADGLIVTNNHVIEGAERLQVTLNDNREFTATVVGADPTTDLALIKIDAPADLHVIPMGDSEQLRVGEWVLAVGNPFGFTSTVTAGIVSAKARNISTMTGSRSAGGIEAYIQTDAAVNQGNSGGALVNLRGELVGINAAIYSRTGTYAGCSFAIPTSIVRKVVDDLSEYGTVQRAYLGIAFRELTPEFVAEKKIKGATQGIYVGSVEDHSAAREAGVSEGDIITAINGIAVTGTARLQEIMARCSPGDTITITVVRDGKEKQLTATLRNAKGDTATVTPTTMTGVLGATFAEVDEDQLTRLEISHGVKVTITSADGAFSRAGINNDFIITAVNGNRITSEKDIETLYNAINDLGPGEDKVMFISGVYPTGRRAHYAVALDQ